MLALLSGVWGLLLLKNQTRLAPYLRADTIAAMPATISMTPKPYTIKYSNCGAPVGIEGGTITIIRIPAIIAKIPPAGVKSFKLP